MQNIDHNQHSLRIGTIMEVHGPVVDIECEHPPSLHQALSAVVNGETYTFEVYRYLETHHVRTITLQNSAGLRRGIDVLDTGSSLRVPVTSKCLGRLLNVFEPH